MHDTTRHTVSALLTSLSLLVALPGAAAPPSLEVWEVSRAQLIGLCQDAARGRTIDAADQQRLAAQEAEQRAQILEASDRATLDTLVVELRAQSNVAKERAVHWIRENMSRFATMLERGPQKLEKRKGRSTPAQREVFLDELDHFQAALARLKAEDPSVQLSDDQKDELIFAVGRLLKTCHPLVEAGAAMDTKLVGTGLKHHAELRRLASLEDAAQKRRLSYDRGERAVAFEGITSAFGEGQPLSSPMRDALAERDRRLQLAAKHDEALRRCGEAPPKESEGAAAKPGPAAASPAAPVHATIPQAEAAAAGPPPASDAPLTERLTYWAAQALADPGPQLPTLGTGYFLGDRWLMDPAAAARRGDGGKLRLRRGGFSLPLDLWVPLAQSMALVPPPKHQTQEHFGDLLKGDKASRRADLDRSLDEGRLPRALEIYQDLTRLPAEEIRPTVETKLAERKAERSVEKGAATLASPPELLGKLPAPPPATKPEAALAMARGKAKAVRGLRYAAPPPLEAPSLRSDGDRRHEERLQSSVLEATERAGREVAQQTRKALSAVRQAEEAIESANEKAAVAHMEAVRQAAFGPRPSSCPAGTFLCGCPELQPLEDLKGRCCPNGATCSGRPPVDLSFDRGGDR